MACAEWRAAAGEFTLPQPYRLDEQVGFVLRQVAQRHAAIFAAGIGSDLTPTQWAALVKLAEIGPVSQNQLGRHTAMDAATIKGVVDRLTRRGFTAAEPDSDDGRRLTIRLTDAGRALVQQLIPHAAQVTEDTVSPLTERGRDTLLALLHRLR